MRLYWGLVRGKGGHRLVEMKSQFLYRYFGSESRVCLSVDLTVCLLVWFRSEKSRRLQLLLLRFHISVATATR